VAAGAERLHRRVIDAIGFDGQGSQRGERRIRLGHPARSRDGGLRVEAVVEQPGHELDHGLRLSVAAHGAERHLGAAVRAAACPA
jgi:hypothetical protein